jgi:hypothetical protein
MRSHLALLITAACSAIATAAGAQATGMPSFNAPYRAFTRSEFGVAIGFRNGAGTAFEGVYRYASSRFDIGFRGGMWDPGACCKTELLVGAEARERVITHTLDFPLDGALVLGAGGALVSGGSVVFIPVGISLGRRIDPQGSTVSIVPYVQPTATLVADGGSTIDFTLGLGADFRFGHAFDARLSVGLGDLDGVSIAAVWVH